MKVRNRGKKIKTVARRRGVQVQIVPRTKNVGMEAQQETSMSIYIYM